MIQLKLTQTHKHKKTTNKILLIKIKALIINTICIFTCFNVKKKNKYIYTYFDILIYQNSSKK